MACGDRLVVTDWLLGLHQITRVCTTLQGGEHPGSAFSAYFSEEDPIAALTYEWTLSFQGILSFLNPVQVSSRPDD